MKKYMYTLGIVAAMVYAAPVAVWADQPADFIPSNTFVAFFQAVHDNPILPMLGSEYQPLVDALDPVNADLNGASYVDSRGPDILFSLGANGLNDPYAELKLIEHFLKNPSAPPVNALTHDLVHAAWNQNEAQFALDIGPSYWTLFPVLLPGFTQILKGEMVIGDGDADTSVPDYVSCTGSAGFIKAIMYLLADYVTNPNPDLNLYGRMPQYFAKAGDADGDGTNNACEYEIYGPPAGSYALYETNALSPSIEPPPGACVTGIRFVQLRGGGWFEDGSPILLQAFVVGASGSITYEWTKNGTVIPMAVLSSLSIPAASAADVGTYCCKATDSAPLPGDPTDCTACTTISVFAVGSLPAGNYAGGILLFAAVCGLGGLILAMRKARVRA